MPSDYSTITSLNKIERTIDGNSLNISWARATDFPSASTKLLGHIIQAIGTDYAKKTEIPTAQANAATSLFLKDSNDQVYEITVDTNGQLTATAVSNS